MIKIRVREIRIPVSRVIDSSLLELRRVASSIVYNSVGLSLTHKVR
jgi:hypothetical protein